MGRNLRLTTSGLLLLACFTSGAFAQNRADEVSRPSDPQLMDAQLADVTFVNASLGWAVGDRGVIWHTADGGRTWKLQTSKVDCRLNSVCFLSDRVGWVAGGSTQPYTGATTGVVLRTTDGGQTWNRTRARILPTIQRIGFIDPENGWALGSSSPHYPSGAYTTNDGGNSWTALGGAADRQWLTGDFLDPHTGALAGRASAAASVRRGTITPIGADFGLRGLQRMKLTAPAGGWLVGDGGLVLNTSDLGNSWQTPAGELPGGSGKLFDFAALAVRGTHVWVAGTPGTRVFHSADGGHTWQAQDTRQSAAIRALAFADEQTGWAVGDFGAILATTDGGRSWRRQQGTASRTAFAGFFSQANEIPLELIARLAADEGYIGAVELLTTPGEANSKTPPDRQAHEATVRAGGSLGTAAWQFPLRSAALKLSADQLVEDWNRVNDGGALDKIEAHLVSRIRMWRPNVVFTVAAEARDPLSLAINQIVLRAVEIAGDGTRFPEQMSLAGLPPWKVQKVFAGLREDVPGNLTINTAHVTPRLGRSLGELAASARGLVTDRYLPARASVGFRLLVDHIPQEVGRRDFFSGIAITPGSDARRLYFETVGNNLDLARREAQMWRNMQAILAQAETGGRDGHFLANMADQTKGLEPDRAAEVLWQLANRYWARGRGDLAAECYEVMAERYAGHPLAGSALVWLVQYYASSETAWRSQSAGKMAVQTASAQQSLGGGRAGVQRAGGAVGSLGTTPATGMISDQHDAETRLAKASGYAKQLEQVDLPLAHEPRVRFPLAVAERQQGLPGQAARFYQALRHARAGDAWSACAATELWTVDRKGQPAKPLWTCSRTTGKPRLDGKLDEPLWRAGNVVELHSPAGDDNAWGAVAILACDEEFLYVGLSCTRADEFRYQASDKVRPHDADLSDQDRVELLVDVDRDYATYYRLTIDHRGWTAESCWGDTTWNPQWFVATGGDEKTWIAEAAIPLSELAAKPPVPGAVWAVGVQRVVPGVGFQSWTQPASPEVTPEGFGAVIFP